MEDEVELLEPRRGWVGRLGDACCAPTRATHRYLVLILMCFLNFGLFFPLLVQPPPLKHQSRKLLLLR